MTIPNLQGIASTLLVPLACRALNQPAAMPLFPIHRLYNYINPLAEAKIS